MIYRGALQTNKQRQCCDCPTMIPAHGNKKRCANCDVKHREKSLLEYKKRARERKALMRKAEITP